MTQLDEALAEVWTETSVVHEPTAFSAAVLERMARRRALSELLIAATLAVAVLAVAMALGPVLGRETGLLDTILTAPPVVSSLVTIAAGLGAVSILRSRSVIERGFWSLGLGR